MKSLLRDFEFFDAYEPRVVLPTIQLFGEYRARYEEVVRRRGNRPRKERVEGAFPAFLELYRNGVRDSAAIAARLGVSRRSAQRFLARARQINEEK